ncbi:MAG: type II toxin-antitoxin system VapC family toxin [Cyclobacteriaceae bacterium]|nr:type II toxin-antitoxin system VapC family toxin [Cyclobacteriaceae bacterium]
MERSYLMDSNVLIDYISHQFASSTEQTLDTIFDNSFHYSVISRLEVLGYNGNTESLRQIEEFLHTGKMYSLTREIEDQTILIRRASPKIKLPDAIIAATAINHNLVLLFRNLSDFKEIANLQLENPRNW